MSGEKDKKETTGGDKELNELLDSALSDFSTEIDENKEKGDPASDGTELWNDEFMAEQAKLLEEKMNSIFGGGSEQPSQDQLAVGFQKMAEAAALALQGNVTPDESDNKYADSIKEALKGLKDGVTNLQAPVSEVDVANMFSGLNLTEGGEDSDANPFLPFMQGMMQSLLSAEILLPSLKELLEKYPKYLEDNKDKISAEDNERFVKQQELFEIICKDLESEKPDDAADVKQDRFKRVLDNMQKLHEYGQPPEDLIGDTGTAGIPGIPGMDAAASVGAGAQCPLM